MTFRGPERVNKLVMIADAGSVAEAADLLATDPSTLVRSWGAFERALGEDLIVDTSRAASLELTSTGRRLVKQALAAHR
jgi:DNA-binding transcriptional LysR family regulator